MAPKRQFALLTIPRTDVVPVSPESTHGRCILRRKKILWENIANGFTEVGTPFEDRSSTSTGNSDGYQTSFRHDVEGKGMVMPPRSILWMRVNKEEMPLSEIHFVSKSHQHEKFEEWAREMLAQPSMP